MKAHNSSSTQSQSKNQKKTSRRSNSTRLISVLLAIILVATMVPALAFATSSEEPVGTSSELGAEVGTEGTEGGDPAAGAMQDAAIVDASTAGGGYVEDAGMDELVTAEGPDRIASEVTLDKAVTPYEIDVIDADSLLQVYIDDVALLPENLTDAIEEEDIEWGTKDNEKLVLAESVVSALDVETYELKLVFADGEEIAELKVKDSVAEAEAAAVATAGAMSGELATLGDEPGTITASIEADNGIVNLNGDADSAVMSWANAARFTVNYYDLTVSVKVADPYAKNTLTVTLPRGMQFRYTDLSKLLVEELVGQFAYDVESYSYTNGGSVTGYTFNSGTCTFVLKEGVSGTALKIPITFDRAIETDTITNAARATLSDGAHAVSETLEKVTRPADAYLVKPNHSHVAPYFTFTDAEKTLSLPDSCRRFNPIPGSYAYAVGITSALITIQLADPIAAAAKEPVRAKVINTDTTNEWEIISSNEAAGTYTFKYTPIEGYAFASMLYVPFAIEFAASPSTAWVNDQAVTATYVAKDSSVSYLQYEADSPAGNIGSTVSLPAVSTKALNVDTVHNFRYRSELSAEDVWVNYTGNTDYLKKDTNPPANNRTFNATISRASSDPLENDLTAGLGSFYMGNAGQTDSAPKTVEIHFDSTAYGVMGAVVPYPVGETLTSVEITTTANNTFYSVPVNVVSAENSGGAYLSYHTLKIANRNVFITGIRYEYGVIPAETHHIAAGTRGMAFYGKWLADNTSGATGTATIEVYDTTPAADPKDTVTTGRGSVFTNNTGTNMSSYPKVSEVAVTAGSVMPFTVSIDPGLDVATGNALTKHPVIYIYSEVYDEKGVPLPVTNVSLTNAGRLSGQIDQKLLTTNHWLVDADGNKVTDLTKQKAVAYVYEIDTAKIPVNQVALIKAYVYSSGGWIGTSGLTLKYQIATTALTETQAHKMRNMVYVFDREATAAALSTTARRITAVSDPAVYKSLRGEDNSGYLAARSTSEGAEYKVTGVQSIHVTSKIKHITGESWTNYTDTAIPVGVSSGSGFELKTNIINNAGSIVTAAEVYIPIPKAKENWGTLAGKTELSLMLTGAALATVLDEDKDPLTGAIKNYTIAYGQELAPTDKGSTLQGYTWITDTSGWTKDDWAKVNCVRIIADDIEDMADLQVILNCKADENQTDPALVEGLTNIWSPYYYRNYSDSTGVEYTGWLYGESFGVQAALSAVKGRVFDDLNKDGIFNPDTETTSGTGWKARVYLADDPTNALQEKTIQSDGTYAFYDLASSNNEAYIIEVINPDSSDSGFMFTRTATRAADNATGLYGPFGANTFVTRDNDATATTQATAKLTVVATAPHDILDEATYNIGIATKALTVLTWQSADATKGTVAGDAGTGVKALSGYPSANLELGAAPAVTAREGYTFMGWARVASGDTPPAWDATPWKTTAVLNSDFGAGNGYYGFDGYDYYAVFTLNTNTITYTYAGDVPLSAETEPGPFTESYGTTQTVANAPASVTGFTFKGWKPTSGITDADITAGSFTMPDVPVVFTGTWERNSHNVVYSYTNATPPAGSDVLLPTTVSTPFATSVTVSSPAPSLTGYTFSGWTSTDTDITSGTFSMPDKQVNIKGTWTAKTYTLTFDKGHDDTSGFTEATPTSKSVTYDTAVGSLPGDDSDASQVAPARTGYVFAGWATTKGAAAADFDKTHVWNTDGNLTVYAVWTASDEVKYTVEHYKVDSTDTPSTTPDATEEFEGTTGETVTASPKTATSDPVFMKGYTYDEQNPLAKPSGEVKADGTLVLRLYYKVNPYTVTYHSNTTANEAPVPDTVYYGEDFTTRAADTFSRAGYTLVSWNNEMNGQGTIGYSPASKQAFAYTQDLDLYAQWTANTGTAYKVEHYLVGTNGVPVIGKTQDIKGITDTTAVASPLSFTGYTYAPNHASAKPSGNIEGDGSLVLRLYYTINYYTVTFIDWNGTTLSSMQVAHGGSAIAPQVLGRAGYSFQGWDKAYTNVTGNLNVYALYSINYYTVTFLDWDGSVLSTQRVAYGGSASSPASPSRAGYTFTGWDRGYTNVTSNITVRALYTPVPTSTDTFTIVFQDHDGSVLQTSTVERGESVTPPTVASHNGYTFQRWNTASSAWTNVTADATIRAICTQGTGGGTTPSTVTPVPTESTTVIPSAEGSPIMNIFGNDVPLFGAVGNWSLFNLLCSILGLVVLVVSLALAFTRKKRIDEKTGRNRGYRRIEGMWVDEDGLIVDEKEEGKRHTRKIPLALVVIAAVVMVVLFILTQNMTLTMALFDIWSIVFAIAVVVGIIAAILTFRHVKVKDEEAPEMQTA